MTLTIIDWYTGDREGHIRDDGYPEAETPALREALTDILDNKGRVQLLEPEDAENAHAYRVRTLAPGDTGYLSALNDALPTPFALESAVTSVIEDPAPDTRALDTRSKSSIEKAESSVRKEMLEIADSYRVWVRDPEEVPKDRQAYHDPTNGPEGNDYYYEIPFETTTTIDVGDLDAETETGTEATTKAFAKQETMPTIRRSDLVDIGVPESDLQVYDAAVEKTEAGDPWFGVDPSLTSPSRLRKVSSPLTRLGLYQRAVEGGVADRGVYTVLKRGLAQDGVEAVERVSKARVYVDDPSEVPDGYHAQQGPQGGTFYNPDDGGDASADESASRLSVEEATEWVRNNIGGPFDTDPNLFDDMFDALDHLIEDRNIPAETISGVFCEYKNVSENDYSQFSRQLTRLAKSETEYGPVYYDSGFNHTTTGSAIRKEFMEDYGRRTMEVVDLATQEWAGSMFTRDAAPIFQYASRLTGNETLPATKYTDDDEIPTVLEMEVTWEEIEAIELKSEQTTDVFREAFGDTITVYRGLSPEPNAPTSGRVTNVAETMKEAAENGETVSHGHRPAEAWTTNPVYASSYSRDRGGNPVGVMLRKEVPVERVIAASHTSQLNNSESEIIVAHDAEETYDPEDIILAEEINDVTLADEIAQHVKAAYDGDGDADAEKAASTSEATVHIPAEAFDPLWYNRPDPMGFKDAETVGKNDRIYVDDSAEVPEGYEAEHGPQGGIFYRPYGETGSEMETDADVSFGGVDLTTTNDHGVLPEAEQEALRRHFEAEHGEAVTDDMYEWMYEWKAHRETEQGVQMAVAFARALDLDETGIKSYDKIDPDTVTDAHVALAADLHEAGTRWFKGKFGDAAPVARGFKDGGHRMLETLFADDKDTITLSGNQMDNWAWTMESPVEWGRKRSDSVGAIVRTNRPIDDFLFTIDGIAGDQVTYNDSALTFDGTTEVAKQNISIEGRSAVKEYQPDGSWDYDWKAFEGSFYPFRPLDEQDPEAVKMMAVEMGDDPGLMRLMVDESAYDGIYETAQRIQTHIHDMDDVDEQVVEAIDKAVDYFEGYV